MTPCPGFQAFVTGLQKRYTGLTETKPEDIRNSAGYLLRLGLLYSKPAGYLPILDEYTARELSIFPIRVIRQILLYLINC